MKRYALHGVAQTPVQALRELIAGHGFVGDQVDNVVVEGDEKLLTHHNIVEPSDIVQAQYSVPFCIAFALFRDPDDPQSLVYGALEDKVIREACRTRIKLQVRPAQSGHTFNTRITVQLRDGRQFAREANTYKGRPSNPLSRDDLRRKFMLLTAGSGEKAAAALFERFDRLEQQPRFSLK